MKIYDWWPGSCVVGNLTGIRAYIIRSWIIVGTSFHRTDFV